MNKTILILILTGLSITLSAKDFITLTYYENDTLSLQLDLFLPDSTILNNAPLFIMVHGGGFSGGDRSYEREICKNLADKGIVSATISYTLYMKNKDFGCDGIVSEKIKAIQYAANDLWLATNFFIENKDKYKIDATEIYIAGSSAGAETVLHAAYWDRNIMSMYDHKLSSTFKYAGLISGAGAIMDLNLITEKNIIPALFFHGSCDELVPYATAAHHYCETNSSGWLMLFGSYSIYQHLLSLNGDAHLITYCGAKHDYSSILYKNGNEQPIVDFIKDTNQGIKFQKHTTIQTHNNCKESEKYHFCFPDDNK